MKSLIYVSTATRPFEPDELRQLLLGARETNFSLGVTGLLLHCEGNFMQALEGPGDAVADLYTRIGRDSRHHGVTLLSLQVIEQREFEGWSMAYSGATAPEFLALSQAGWSAQGTRGNPAGRGRRMLRDFWAACRRS